VVVLLLVEAEGYMFAAAKEAEPDLHKLVAVAEEEVLVCKPEAVENSAHKSVRNTIEQARQCRLPLKIISGSSFS
jgi:hypothetical protein